MTQQYFWNTRLYDKEWNNDRVCEAKWGLATRKSCTLVGSIIFAFLSSTHQNRLATPLYLMSTAFSIFGAIRGDNDPTLSSDQRNGAIALVIVTAGLISASPFFSQNATMGINIAAVVFAYMAELFGMCTWLSPYIGKNPCDTNYYHSSWGTRFADSDSEDGRPRELPLSSEEIKSYETQSRLINFHSKAAWGALIAAFMQYTPLTFTGAATAAAFFGADQLLSIIATLMLPLSARKKFSSVGSYLTASGLLALGLLSFHKQVPVAGAVCSIIGCAIPTLNLAIRHALELQPVSEIAESAALVGGAKAAAVVQQEEALPSQGYQSFEISRGP